MVQMRWLTLDLSKLIKQTKGTGETEETWIEYKV